MTSPPRQLTAAELAIRHANWYWREQYSQIKSELAFTQAQLHAASVKLTRAAPKNSKQELVRELFLKGLTYRQMQHQLGVSKTTIGYHLRALGFGHGKGRRNHKL